MPKVKFDLYSDYRRQITSRDLEAIRRKLRAKYYLCRVDEVRVVEPWRMDLKVVHRWLRLRSAAHAVKNFARVNRWPRDKLPIIVRFRRQWIVWDGHHRVFASRLLRRRLRCRVVVF